MSLKPSLWHPGNQAPSNFNPFFLWDKMAQLQCGVVWSLGQVAWVVRRDEPCTRWLSHSSH
jgi:hypothetical protein